MALPPRVASARAGKRALGQGRLLVNTGRRKGRGWGEDPISPPCSRPLGRVPQMGLGEGAGFAPPAWLLHRLRGPAWFSGIAAQLCALQV